ncbi:VWA domain-containing protein [Massilia violaceinigra]|uniref:VWA domain-containing protein n=1 Tax=Massilia violaceinigra TaxID=2045208 RepID=A0ABY4A482_9BURK|nr:VWA domain-containing protein [Massilia violaceinigra]UOD29167.1 VWA domain-containing protein [Massilia violaceinigra]
MSERALDADTLRRWRLVLGAAAEVGLRGTLLDPTDKQRDQALGFLYDREQDADPHDRSGGSGRADPAAVRWLGKVRTLFPQTAAEVLQRDALERYQLHGLLTDPAVLDTVAPSMDLVRILLGLRHMLPAPVLAKAQEIVATVVAELEARLAPRALNAFAARRQHHARGGKPRLSDLDWPHTMRHNLRHYQPDTGELVLERLFFKRRHEQRLPWHLWVVVDQSGSMSESVIHSAVMASIFARLRAVRTRMLLFADDVTDASSQLHAPEKLLMSVQIGGGTNIGAALACARGQIDTPRRSVVVLISDLYEGGTRAPLLRETAALTRSGVTVLVLAALDRQAEPDYDRETARLMVACGAEAAAMTPDALIDWLATRMQS